MAKAKKSFDLCGKVALITGGSSGIGLAYIKEMLKRGLKGATIVDCNDRGQKVACDLGENVTFMRADVTKSKRLERTFKDTLYKYGNLDIVINNAGTMREDNWAKIVNLNARAVTIGTMLGFKYLGKDKCGNGGTIINTSSVLGINYLPAAPIYTATNHFIIGLTRSMGTDFYRETSGVKVMSICAGLTDTELIELSPRGRLPFRCIEKEFIEELQHLCPQQKKGSCAKALIKALQCGVNGAVWVVQHNKEASLCNPHGTIFKSTRHKIRKGSRSRSHHHHHHKKHAHKHHKRGHKKHCKGRKHHKHHKKDHKKHHKRHGRKHKSQKCHDHKHHKEHHHT